MTHKSILFRALVNSYKCSLDQNYIFQINIMDFVKLLPPGKSITDMRLHHTLSHSCPHHKILNGIISLFAFILYLTTTCIYM